MIEFLEGLLRAEITVNWAAIAVSIIIILLVVRRLFFQEKMEYIRCDPKFDEFEVTNVYRPGLPRRKIRAFDHKVKEVICAAHDSKKNCEMRKGKKCLAWEVEE